jgi:serine/threonine protein kinase
MAPVLAANADFCQQFLKEGRITAKLSHPHLVTVHDIGSYRGTYYMASEYLSAGSLRERLQTGLGAYEALNIAHDLASGLTYAHEMGFVHRDVKPGNILFRKDGSVVLADFGIAKAMDSSSSSTVAGASIGTPDYMSPEQARAEPVDGRSDLYSLGTVLYEMLTGAPPYQAADPFTVALMHVTQPIPTLPPDFSWLQPLIDRTMNKQPAERVQTGAILAEEIHQLLAKSPEGASTLSKTAAKSSNRISSGATMQRTRMIQRDAGYPRWLWPAVGTGVAALAVGGWLLLRQPDALPPAQVLTPTQPTASSGAGDVTGTSGSTDTPGIIHPQTIENELGGDVQQMLEQADAYKQHGITSKEDIGRNLVSPDGANAAELYRKVLAIQPDNKQAKQGLLDIAAFYTSFAQRTCDAGLYGACKTNAENGLVADPDNAGLKLLDKKADDAARGNTPSGG